jgi:hypothetical protein
MKVVITKAPPLLVYGTMLLLATISGCSTDRPVPETNGGEAAKLFHEAAERVMQLGQSGNLPGFSEEDRGMIRSHRLASDAGIAYPVEIPMQIEKAKDEDVLYWFILLKRSEHSEFEVVEAWTTDFRGENKQVLLKR